MKNKNTSIDILNMISNENGVYFDEYTNYFNEKFLSILDNKEQKIKLNNKKNNFLNGFIFLIKYIFTSSIIFGILLIGTNYQAYMQLANNFLNPNKMEMNSQNMLASIQSTKINKANANQDENNISSNKKIELLQQNNSIHSINKLIQNNTDIDLDINIIPYENRIVIPRISKNIPLVEVENKKVRNVKELDQVFMDELANGIVRYPGSARPGEIGNSFIFGHSSNFPWVKGDFNDVFAMIDHIIFGDEIIVYYNQKKYVYVVKEKKVIKPGEVGVLSRNTGKSEISLMTCWPIGTSINRMIVIAELKEVSNLN